MSSISPYQLPLFPQRKCSDCKEIKPLDSEHFPREHRRKDGLSYRCKECSNRRSRAWYQANRACASRMQQQKRRVQHEAVLAYDRAYRERHPDKFRLYAEARRRKRGVPVRMAMPEQERKERRRASVARYAINHPERVRASQRAWREAHPERWHTYARAYSRAHYDAHRAVYIARGRNRRALVRGAPGSHTTADLHDLFIEQAGRCYYCGIVLKSRLHVDHKTPLSRGGSNWPDNLAWTCALCNLRKHTKTEDEYRALLAQRTSPRHSDPIVV